LQPTTEQVYRSALALPAEERFQLIEALIAAEQPPPPFDASLRPVVQRRSAELDSGAVADVPWEEVRERLRRQVGLDG
jgi:putative addiction module component (TIGR02574 family)